MAWSDEVLGTDHVVDGSWHTDPAEACVRQDAAAPVSARPGRVDHAIGVLDRMLRAERRAAGLERDLLRAVEGLNAAEISDYAVRSGHLIETYEDAEDLRARRAMGGGKR